MRLQRPEYLGGERIPINIDQVIQTSGTMEGTTPQGNTGAYSLTGNQGSYFKHSFVEHGYVLGLACVEPNTPTSRDWKNLEPEESIRFLLASPGKYRRTGNPEQRNLPAG